ncbi:hypothetical protein [Parafilimonas sp.]|uniref:hypothetical protein n=1 Tax=Parafilimonas sp. TaxID=1969739 RepID=UPI003F817485
MQHGQRSKLMRLSWQIQRRRHYNRSKSLISAWAIYLNEDITVFHLVQKHGGNRGINYSKAASLTLFNQ